MRHQLSVAFSQAFRRDNCASGFSRVRVWRPLFSLLALVCLAASVSGCGSGIVGTSSGMLVISPGTIDFGSVSVGKSANSNVTITNSGSVEVPIAQITLPGQTFSLVGSERLPFRLAPGASHTLSIEFAPASASDYSGQFTILDSKSKAVGSLLAKGRGVRDIQVLVSASSVNFGSVAVNSSRMQTITLTSTGSTPVTLSSAVITGAGFSIVAGTFPLALNPFQSVMFQIQFSPTTSGFIVGQLAITTDAISGATTQVVLNGMGVAATSPPTPQLTVSSTGLNLGDVTVNSLATQMVTLTSMGTAPVMVSSATISGGAFSLIGGGLPATLSPGQSMTLRVQFKPTVAGNASGQLAINSNSTAGNVALVSLVGNGVASNPLLTISAMNLAFGNVGVNSATTSTVTLTSMGTAPVTVNSITTSGGVFSLTGTGFPATLNPGQSMTVQVQFKPTVAGSANGQLMINSNSTVGAAALVSLAGNGIASNPVLSVSTTAVAFGSVAVNSTITSTVTLTSTGTTPVTVNSATINNISGFTLLGGSFPITLNPSQSSTLQLQFKPTASGEVAGQLTISSDSANGSLMTVSLSGTGTVVQHEVDLRWDAPTDLTVPVAGYNIYRSTSSGGSAQLVNSSVNAVTNYVDNTVAGGTTYSYVVKSVSGSGIEGPPSNQITLAIP